MLFSDLALILTIMINTLVLHQSSEAGILPGNGQPNFYPQGVHKSSNNLDVNEKIRQFPGKNGRANKTIKMRQRWYLYPVMLKLAIAIDKYDMKRGLIGTIYSGVIECGLDKCGKLKELIPDDQLIGPVKCFKNNFKKMISNNLLNFQKGVRIIEKTLLQLISFEDKSRFNNRSRRTILKELRSEMKMLNLELETVINKRLNFSRQPEPFKPSSIPQPDNETHLIINEWRIIQDSKRFLQEWQKNFEKIFRCWKKRRQKKEKKKKRPGIQIDPLTASSLSPPPTHPRKFSRIRGERKTWKPFPAREQQLTQFFLPNK